MHPMLNIAVRAARRAGSIINRAALDSGGFEVRSKRVNDFVTKVDHAAEEAIIEIVRKAYPDHAVLAEESGITAGRAEYQWIIDPLDGTTNFIHGFPQYCVSIAIRHRDALAHGVIYDPVKNELFTASKGRGAFLNDRRMRVSKCIRLADALVGTGFPFKEVTQIDRYAKQLRTIMTSTSGVRRAGAAALDLAYVACGRLDAFWELGLSAWDMAAGALMIQEAGGLVGDLRGDAGYLESGEICAATPKIFPTLLEALAGQSAQPARIVWLNADCETPSFAPALVSPGLCPRDRSLATVSALVAMNRPDQLRSHLARARENGVTQDELIEAITHLAFYAGWPSAVSASTVAREVFQKK